MTKYTECLIVPTSIKVCAVIVAADPVSGCKYIVSPLLITVFFWLLLFIFACLFPCTTPPLASLPLSWAPHSLGLSLLHQFHPCGSSWFLSINKVNKIKVLKTFTWLEDCSTAKEAVSLKSCYKEKTCGNLTGWIKHRQTTIYQHCNQWNMDMLFKRKIIPRQ